MTTEPPSEPPPEQPDIRKYQKFKRTKKVQLARLCRDPSHESVIWFENISDAQAHEIETGHKTKLERIEVDE